MYLILPFIIVLKQVSYPTASLKTLNLPFLCIFLNNQKMANNDDNSNKILPQHHVQQELCTTRPLYRQGRNLTAVKVCVDFCLLFILLLLQLVVNRFIPSTMNLSI